MNERQRLSAVSVRHVVFIVERRNVEIENDN